MSSVATIGEPFALASYSTSKIHNRGDGNARRSTVYATFEKPSDSSEGYVTVAAQADGIHILDVATLHPVASHTLGPSTTFSGPAITCISPAQDTISSSKLFFTIYAPLALSADLPNNKANGKTIWIWRESHAAAADQLQEQKSFVVAPHNIAQMYNCNAEEHIAPRIILLSKEGDVTVVDREIQTKSTHKANEGRNMFSSFIFRRANFTFITGNYPSSRGTILVLVLTSASNCYVQILSIDHEDTISLVEELDLPFKPDQIASTSCSPTGCFTLLAKNGAWHAYRLAHKPESPRTPSVFSAPIHLNNLTFSSPTLPSLLALTSSHVLLAALTPKPNSEIAILLWDVQYSVLLASHILPIPATLNQDTPVRIEIAPAAGSSQALLVLSPFSASNAGSAIAPRSNVLVIPYDVPVTSKIANAIGRGSVGAHWVKQDERAKTMVPPYGASQMKIVEGMRAAMEQKKPQVANIIFFDKVKQVDGKDSTRSLGYIFVKDVLHIVLQPAKSSNTPYSSDVVRYLLEQKVVTNNMLEGKLLAILRARNDWPSIDLALRTVLDISELELIHTLQVVVTQHRSTLVPDVEHDTAQNVSDVVHPLQSSEIPSLSSFLASCLICPISVPQLRLAFRAHMREADDLVCILQVLEEWVRSWTQRKVRLLPSEKDLKTNAHGILIVKEEERKKKKEKTTPPLEKIVIFLQTLLDASFTNLLPHPLAQRILQRLAINLNIEIDWLEKTEQLWGALEPFALTHTRLIREAEQEAQRKAEGRQLPQQDWRQRKKQANAQAGMAIGVYQLEELAL